MRWLAAWLAAGLMLAGLVTQPAGAQSIAASPPTDVSVTVYRAPGRVTNALDLDFLEGFALVTETRTVSLPAGETRVRFEGVADGIEPASSILAGLPATLLEKNRDARTLSPSALVAATVGHRVVLVRTDPKTHRQTRVPGMLRAASDGVVFQSAAGLEALRCSGLPETFQFSGITALAPTPTLSVRVRSERAVSAPVILSYLAHGFDWTATYTARVTPDARTMDLGAWVTLANGNGVSFPEARVQIVAGRLNRVSGQVEPIAVGQPVLAECWPAGTTSDLLPEEGAYLLREEASDQGLPPPPPYPAAMAIVSVTRATPVVQEPLGDLKLYRVPARTTLASRQMKQVRLLDRFGIPVQLIHTAWLRAGEETNFAPAQRLLRTRNDAAHHLGLPLPSGVVDTFTWRGTATLFLHEAQLRDTAEGEDVEIALGDAPDVQVRAVTERRRIPPGRIREIPLIPGVARLRSAVVDQVSRIEISNASGAAVTFEARLQLPEGAQLIRATAAPIWRSDQPVFTLEVPAAARATIRYQTEHPSQRLTR